MSKDKPAVDAATIAAIKEAATEAVDTKTGNVVVSVPADVFTKTLPAGVTAEMVESVSNAQASYANAVVSFAAGVAEQRVSKPEHVVKVKAPTGNCNRVDVTIHGQRTYPQPPGSKTPDAGPITVTGSVSVKLTQKATSTQTHATAIHADLSEKLAKAFK